MSNNLKLGIEWQIGQIPTSSFDQLASSLGKVDQASQTTGQNLGSIADATTGIGTSLDGMNQGLNETSGTLEELSGSTGETAEGFQTMSEGASDLGEGLGGMQDAAEGSVTTFADLATGLEDTSSATGGVATGLEDVTTGLDTAATSTEGVNTGFAELVTGLGDTTTGLETTTEGLDTTTSGLDTVAESADTSGGAIQTFGENLEGAATSADTATTSTDTLGGSIGDTNEIATTATPSLEDLAASFEGAGMGGEAAAEGMGVANDTITNVGTSTGTTKKNTDAMKGSVTGLGIGMAGIVGAGVSLFNTIDDIGDAQVGVKAATLAMDKQLIVLDGNMINLGKTMNNILTNQKLGITNTDGLKDAYDRLNGLVKDGVTSGSEFESALADLRKEQSELTSNTDAGKTAIATFGKQLDTTALTAGKLEIKQNDLDNANEALNQSWTALATQAIPALVAGAGSATGTYNSLRMNSDQLSKVTGKLTGTFGKMKGAIAGIGFATMLGPMGKLTIIIGIAVAAAVLFISQYDKIRPVLQGAAEAIITQIGHLQNFTKALKDLLDPYLKISERDAILKKDMEKTGEATDKAAKKTVTFGDNWNQLVKDLGVDDLIKMTNQMIAGGGATEDTAAAVDELDVKQQAIQSTIQGYNKLLADQATTGMSATDMFQMMQGEVVNLGNGLTSVNGVLMKTTPEMLKVGTTADTASESMTKQQNAIAGSVEEWNKYRTVGGIIDVNMKKTNDEIERQSKLVGMLQEETSKTTAEYLEEKDAVDQLLGAYGILGDELDLTLKQKQALAESFEATFGAIDQEKLSLEADKTMWGLVTDSMVENTVAKEEQIRALTLENSGLVNAAKARLDYERAVTLDYQALIKEIEALNISIEMSRQAVNSKEELTASYLRGVDSIRKWSDGLALAREEERGQLEELANLGVTFSDLPGAIEPTVENLKAFKEATDAGGLAAIEFGEKVMDSWGRLTGDVGGKMQGLVDIIKKGGKDMDESSDKWFEDLEAQIGRKLSDAERTALEHIGNMKTEGEKILGEFNLDVFTGNIDSGMAEMEQSFRNAAQTSDPIFSQMFTSMANIADSGSKELIARMVEAFNSDAPPQAILTQMKTIEGQIGQVGVDAGKAGGTGIGQGLVETGQPAAKSAVITMSEEFAALGTHTAAVVSGMQFNFDKLSVTAVAQAMLHDFTSMAATALDNIAGIKEAFPVISQAASASASSMAQDYTSSAAKAQQNVAGIKNAFPVITKAADSAAQKVASSFSSAAKHSISMINGIQNSINKIKGKTVYIDVRQRRVGPVFAEHGFHGIVTEPTLIIAGEKRPERVDIGSTASTTKSAVADKRELEKQILMPAKSGGVGRNGGVQYVTKAIQPVVIKMKDRVIGELLNEIILDGTETIY